MNILKINTKNGYFEIKNVYKVCMSGLLLFVFYEDKKVKIPVADVVSFEITTEENGE
jgi:hypothetical protein